MRFTAKQPGSIEYSVGKKGDIIVTDYLVKKVLGERKHIVLTGGLARRFAEWLAQLPRSEVRKWLEKLSSEGVLRRTGEGRSVVFYSVDDFVVDEKTSRTSKEKTVERGGWTERWLGWVECREKHYLSGRTEKTCRDVDWELDSRTRRERSGAFLVELYEDAKTGARRAYITIDDEAFASISDKDVLRMVEDAARKLRGMTRDEKVLRSALRLWLAGQGEIHAAVASGMALPPAKVLKPEYRGELDALKKRLEEQGYRVHVNNTSDYSVHADYEWEFPGFELSAAQRRLLEMLRPIEGGGYKEPSKAGDAITEAEEVWHDCMSPACSGVEKTVRFGGATIDVLVNLGEVVRVGSAPRMSPEEALELAEALLEPNVVSLEDAVEEARRELEAELERIKSGLPTMLLPRNRYACWSFVDCDGREKTACVVTAYSELEVPTRFATIEKREEHWWGRRSEERYYVCRPVDYKVVKTQPLSSNANVKHDADMEHWIRATEKARREAAEKVLDLLAAL